MSKTLDRYIFTELISPFVVSLSALCFVIFTKEMLRLVELLVSKGIGFLSVLNVIAHLMPAFLVLTLPMACLIASISTFSRFSLDNEVIAMRAAGFSLARISLPVIIFSVLVFLLTMILSTWGQPWSNTSTKKLVLSLIQDRITLALDKGVFNEPFPGLMVYVPKPKESHATKGVFISDQRDPHKPLIIVANSMRILNDRIQHQQFGLRLFQGTIHQAPSNSEQYHRVGFTTYDLRMDFPKALKGAVEARPTYEEIVHGLNQSGWKDSHFLRRLMEYYKDLSFPVASLLFGVLGLPVGIVAKRSGRAGGFALGILIIVAYYMLDVLGEFSVITLVLHPFAGAWFPNIVLGLATIILFYRATKQ